MANHDASRTAGKRFSDALRPSRDIGATRKGRRLQQDERHGVMLAILGYILLSIGDGVLKSVAGEWATTAIGALRYTIGAVLLGIAVFAFEGRDGFRAKRPFVHLMRGGGVALAMASFVTSLRFMPLIDATAIGFTSPIITAFLAAIFLGEKVTRATWFATLLGFAGVLIVLRPSLLDLGALALLPLLVAFGMSLLVIGNRMAAGEGSALSMQFLVAAPAAVFLTLFTVAGHLSGVDFLHVNGSPNGKVMMAVLFVTASATAAHWLIYLATTKSGASSIAPLTYVQVLVAGLIGWLAFAHRPDLTALLGIAVIVASGLVLWHSHSAKSLPDEAG